MADPITREELRNALDEGRNITVVESLSEEAYEKEHIPGAINVPQEKVKDLAAERLPDKSAEIVVYCANTACQSSAETARALEDLGYENVRDYEAGKKDWIDAGLPVESGGSVSAGA